jgi:hypothetical protein
MLNGNVVLPVFGNSVVVSVLLFDTELVCAWTWGILGIRGKSFNPGAKYGLLLRLCEVVFGGVGLLVEEGGLLMVIDVHYFIIESIYVNGKVK